MQASDITFPSTIGLIVTTLRTFLSARGWSSVTVQPKLPTVKTARMVTVRDDGGSDRNGIERRRHGLNVWGGNPVDAEGIARDVAAGVRSELHATNISILEVEDDADEVLTVGSSKLTHYFVAFTLPVRATNL
ncbi:hypothetical protein [Agromyces sp. SYSU T00194]|uniref:hypothetical protein n=1 Tax=Agromyces chitinivorans TaxID=3158560 RepID=UPI00339A005A